MKSTHWKPARGVLFVIMSMIIVKAGAVYGETTVTPSITLTERYDSNVFFTQGKNLDDFVTVAAPLLRVDHDNHFMKGNLSGGVTSSIYAKNPGFNYVAANGSAALNLDQALERIVSGLSLELKDTFRYTPETPSFMTSQTGNQVPSSFILGIQASRANTFSNRGEAISGLALSQTVNWKTSYLHQYLKFGTPLVAPVAGTLFNTTFQTVNTGPQWQVSPNDTVSLTYQYVKSTFTQGGGFGGGFETNGGLIGWTKVFSPQLTASVSAGLTVFPSGEVQHLENASVEWTSGQNQAHVTYSRSVMPSFFIAGVPLVSNMVLVGGTHNFTGRLSGNLMGSYAKNESVPAGILEFQSYSYGPRMEYGVTESIKVSVSYTHSKFGQQFASRNFDFSRDQVMLTLHGEWK